MSDTKPKHPGLDGRSRNENGRIREKNGNTELGTLREIYGDGFATGRRSDMHLDTLLRESGVDSLSQYLKSGK